MASKRSNTGLSTLLLFGLIFYLAAGIPFSRAEEEKPKEEKAPLAQDEFSRDPFVSLLREEDLRQSGSADLPLDALLFPMTLKGLMMKKDKAVAIINEEVVREGQIWHDLKIEHIDKEGVTLGYQGKSLRLVMKEELDTEVAPAQGKTKH